MATPNITVRVSGSLRKHLEQRTSEYGNYETPSEYIRDLIRHDMIKQDKLKWDKLRTHIAEGLSYQEQEFEEVDREDFFQRAEKRNSLNND